MNFILIIISNNFIIIIVQIFSNSVAAGLKFYFQQELRGNLRYQKLTGYEAAYEFTLRINKMFDALNTNCPNNGIRANRQEQLEVKTIKFNEYNLFFIYFK